MSQDGKFWFASLYMIVLYNASKNVDLLYYEVVVNDPDTENS